jgi:hypothetical protein
MNFFKFCEDEAVKIKVEGLPVHRFFAPEGFLQWGLEPKLGNYNGYAQIVDMPIEEFIGLAEPIPEDDEKRHAPMEKFKSDVANGAVTNWDVPYLVIQENEDGIWKVVGHDGRHRAMLLDSLGYKTMPVLLRLPDAELNEELLPEILWSQNDKAVQRDKDFYDFPITEDNFQKPYVSVSNGVMVSGDGEKTTTIAMDGIDYGKGCDAPNLKRYLGEVKAEDKSSESGFKGIAPESCTSAKKNFAKNFVANVAYRKDNTMPARNLKEYLSRKG